MRKNLELRGRARSLREQGFSLVEIQQTLPKHVPKSTLSGWCKGIALSPEAILKLKVKSEQALLNAREISVESRKRTKEHRVKSILEKYSGINVLFGNAVAELAILAILYLAEGTKGKNGNMVFGNSDPKIINLFLLLLRRNFDIDEKKFRCTIQLRHDQNIPALEAFWSEATSIPLRQFYKARVDPRSIGKVTKKAEYKGVCRIDYFSSALLLEILTIGTILTAGP